MAVGVAQLKSPAMADEALKRVLHERKGSESAAGGVGGLKIHIARMVAGILREVLQLLADKQHEGALRSKEVAKIVRQLHPTDRRYWNDMLDAASSGKLDAKHQRTLAQPFEHRLPRGRVVLQRALPFLDEAAQVGEVALVCWRCSTWRARIASALDRDAHFHAGRHGERLWSARAGSTPRRSNGRLNTSRASAFVCDARPCGACPTRVRVAHAVARADGVDGSAATGGGNPAPSAGTTAN